MRNRDRQRPDWLDPSLFPFRLGHQQLPDGRISFVDEGAGPPVLLVHGTPGWSFEYRSVIPLLSSAHRVVAPDLLGFGLSDRVPGGDYTVRAHAARLTAFIEALDLQDLHLVVHDFGGPIGLGAALDHLDRVKSITVMNTWMWPLNGNAFFERARFLTGGVGRFLYHRLNFSARVLVPQAFADKKRLSKRVHRHYVQAQDREAREAAFAFAREVLGAQAFLADLWESRELLAPRIRSVLWGMADGLLPADQLLPRWREAFPEARFIEVPDAGHYVQEEAPKEVAKAVSDATLAPLGTA